MLGGEFACEVLGCISLTLGLVGLIQMVVACILEAVICKLFYTYARYLNILLLRIIRSSRRKAIIIYYGQRCKTTNK